MMTPKDKIQYLLTDEEEDALEDDFDELWIEDYLPDDHLDAGFVPYDEQ